MANMVSDFEAGNMLVKQLHRGALSPGRLKDLMARDIHLLMSNYPPAKPGVLRCEPLKAV
jgi:hypothetical protein